MDTIRVLITDDHFIVREGLRLILETTSLVEVVGEATDGADCLRQIPVLLPHVVLMDLQMPGMDGLTAIGHLRQEHPDVAIVILTTYNEDEMMLKGLQAGANSYLLKDTDRETLLDTIQAAAKGETLLKPEILQRALRVQQHLHSPKAGAVGDNPLTDRELETLERVASGERNKEIAYNLGITERTVKAHLASIYNKLGVDSRAAAVAIATQRGLIISGR